MVGVGVVEGVVVIEVVGVTVSKGEKTLGR